MTKKETVQHWKSKLGNNIGWAVRGVLAIYKNQTDEEKCNKSTLASNGLGFTSYDAVDLTKIAERYQNTQCLTHIEKRILLYRMPKYANQLYRLYGER